MGKPGNTATRICWLGIPVACGRDRDWVSPKDNDDRDMVIRQKPYWNVRSGDSGTETQVVWTVENWMGIIGSSVRLKARMLNSGSTPHSSQGLFY